MIWLNWSVSDGLDVLAKLGIVLACAIAAAAILLVLISAVRLLWRLVHEIFGD